MQYKNKKRSYKYGLKLKNSYIMHMQNYAKYANQTFRETYTVHGSFLAQGFEYL